MDNHFEDDEEDNRKPAARPVEKSPSILIERGDDDNNGTFNESQFPHDHENAVQSIVGEIPFLITHWLSGYTANIQDEDSNNNTAAALVKIKKATADLATAFQMLGAFGKKAKPSLGSLHYNIGGSERMILSNDNNASYSDMKRSWPSCSTQQLDKLLQSSQSATVALCETTSGSRTINQMNAIAEGIANNKNLTSKNVGGRTLQDSISALGESGDNCIAINMTATSTLNAPVILTKQKHAVDESDTLTSTDAISCNVALHLVSSTIDLATSASSSMRNYLDMRASCQNQMANILKLKRSLKHQQDLFVELNEERAKINNSNQVNGVVNLSTSIIVQLDNIQVGVQNCERVIAQLQRQIPQLERSLELDNETLITLKEQSSETYSNHKSCCEKYQDPLHMVIQPGLPNNRIHMNVLSRQFGIDRYLKQNIPRAMGRVRVFGSTNESAKEILLHRLSHAATINTHLAYPVYCLKFDRTGQYFITGADDYLVKVFCTCGSLSVKQRGQVDPTSCVRGAVLVCTLKGHAGVINDIGVSSDNLFLASASEDGDCRIWGLQDGRPITILRGHVGGATSVSWSMLTPYRLVTTGADGLARNWDIREALLKRYSKFIGNRPEYVEALRSNSIENGGEVKSDSNMSIITVDPVPILPLPTRIGESERIELPEQRFELPDHVQVADPPPVPIPVGLNNLPNNAIEVEDGRFVANDNVEEGVTIISRLQHGATLDETGGPGTRGRKSMVKVLSVVRCPYGGHFATGSDDGICRIWQDEPDIVVENIDLLHGILTMHESNQRNENVVVDPLISLKGHLSAITDLHYSYQGDRIVTASQKDGVIRIWSWNMDPVLLASQLPNQDSRIRNISHILLKLTNPNCGSTNESRPGPRARPNRSQTSRIRCDGAVWTIDDTKIVSSQSELAKESSTAIVPGSQYLFIWDSFTGHCLLGIPSAHSMDCQVLLPHPLLPSIICSAGADGVVKLWDLEAGKCIFTHENTATFGPVDTFSERGKNICYLDGDFSPDGTSLVLSDESGRITVLDSFGSIGHKKHASAAFPDWMKEQYFSNDYYDLLYDANGYCVERGSGLPPHLSPKGVRCSHSGAPFPIEVNEAFKGLKGPSVVNVDMTKWNRQMIRTKAHKGRSYRILTKGNIVRQYDPLTTVMLGNSNNMTISKEQKAAVQPPQSDAIDANRSPADLYNTSGRRLSSNYRWRDYTDIDFGEEDDQDQMSDSDYELHEVSTPIERNSQGRVSRIVDTDSDSDIPDDESNRPTSRANRRTIAAFDQSSDDEYVEYVSSNNTPSGSYVADYDLHFFRMISRDEGNSVHRQWLRRTESSSSYGGRKSYHPQVGDSVVYIPRIHQNTLATFPGVQTPPWQQWPGDAVWPVVRCCIRNIRFRFPYKAYNKEVVSVVAKLILEVTGVPEHSPERSFGWPSPIFINTTQPFVFELALFENKEDDYIIPMGLYVSRLQQLEKAISNQPHEIRVEAFFADSDESNDTEDPPFVTYIGRVVRFDDNFDRDVSNPNMFGSGFNSLAISWDDGTDNDPDQVSPWDVSPQSEVETPERPKLSELEKNRVRDGIKTILRLPGGKDFFLNPVDVTKYSDYATRVEVPMDISFIKNRLEADYYGSRYSVVADVMLIVTNCKKYNGDNDELSDLANEMLLSFEDAVLDADERIWFHKYDTPLIEVVPQETMNTETSNNAQERSSSVVKKSKRLSMKRSSLENIQGSGPKAVRLRPRPNTMNTSQPRVRITRRTQEVERSVLEAVRPSNVQTLEQLSSSRGQSTRGRATRSTSAITQAPYNSAEQESEEHPRRALRIRGTVSNPTYAEVDRSDIDEIDLNESYTTSRQRTSRAIEARTNSHRQPLRSRDQHGTYETTRQRTSRGHEARTNASIARSRSTDVDLSATRQNPATIAITRRSGIRNDVPDAQSPNRHIVPRASRRNTRSSIHGKDEDSDQEDQLPSNGRQASRNVKVSNSDSESDLYHEQTPKPTFSKNSRATRRSVANHNSDLDFPDSDDNKHTRSTRSRKRVASDPESDFEDSDESDDKEMSESDSESSSASPIQNKYNKIKNNASKKSTKNGNAKGRGRHEETKRTRDSPLRGTRARTTYYDPSSSDIETGSDDDSDDVSIPKKGPAKRNGAKQKGSPPKKKAKSADNDINLLEKYQIKNWPEIPLKRISDVTMALLMELKTSDEDDLFLIPVVEAYPNIKDQYLQRIKKPMDFRTIEEERLWHYQSITELQHDLILVYHNCMEYNDPDSPLYHTASLMMGLLNDQFHTVCSKLRVRFLHH